MNALHLWDDGGDFDAWYQRLGDHRGRTRHSDPDTSRAAAEQITGRIDREIMVVFDAQYQAYPSLGRDHGLTDDELTEWLPTRHRESVKTARSRLTRAGFLCDSGERRPVGTRPPDDRVETNVSSRFMVCDVFDGIATLEDGSVDLVVTSPPFLALRSYLPADHPDKAKELGSEATPGEFIDTLLDVVEACARVLAPHGSLVFELGDTYSGAGGYGSPDSPNPAYGNGERFAERWEGRTRKRFKKADDGWPLDKSKVLVPQLFAVALAYGFNPLTGRQTEPWRVRNTVAWCRPNPPVGRDGDKFRPATSFLTVACKARDRYWDGDAVRHPHIGGPHAVGTAMVAGEPRGDTNGASNPAGAPLLDWWELPTHPYPGAHYATFPPDLVVPLVKAMCPRRVCVVCGKPSRRIVESVVCVDGVPVDDPKLYGTRFGGARLDDGAERSAGYKVGPSLTGVDNNRVSNGVNTLGWSDCGCDFFCEHCYAVHGTGTACEHRWRSGMVLDPFAGSGTTLAVALGHGFDAVGFDLDPRNADLARERCGMFLEVEAQPFAGGPVPEPRIR